MAPAPSAAVFAFRILYVDDSRDLASLYADMLRQHGYEVHVAHSGFEALACLRQSLPDLVISDLRMPDMSGLELLTIIRQRFPCLPLLAISAGDLLYSAALSVDAAFNRQSAQELHELVAGLVRPELARRYPMIRPRPLPWVERLPGEKELRVICSDCLRSFTLPASAIAGADAAGIRVGVCCYCGFAQPYLLKAAEAA